MQKLKMLKSVNSLPSDSWCLLWHWRACARAHIPYVILAETFLKLSLVVNDLKIQKIEGGGREEFEEMQLLKKETWSEIQTCSFLMVWNCALPSFFPIISN